TPPRISSTIRGGNRDRRGFRRSPSPAGRLVAADHRRDARVRPPGRARHHGGRQRSDRRAAPGARRLAPAARSGGALRCARRDRPGEEDLVARAVVLWLARGCGVDAPTPRVLLDADERYTESAAARE